MWRGLTSDHGEILLCECSATESFTHPTTGQFYAVPAALDKLSESDIMHAVCYTSLLTQALLYIGALFRPQNNGYWIPRTREEPAHEFLMITVDALQ